MINFLNANTVDWAQVRVITVVGYMVVFCALIILVFAYKAVPKILHFQLSRKLKKEGKYKEPEKGKSSYIAGDVNAAIGMALALYLNEMHDDESNIITIKRVARIYSPWSSKIYGTTNVLSSRH